MVRQSRLVSCFAIVVFALACSAALLGWPHPGTEFSSGMSIGGASPGRSSLHYIVRSYGYWPYLTFVEERGARPSGLPPVIVGRPQAGMTALCLVLLWATALLLLLIGKATGPSRRPALR
jgi:hypothetical protein